MQLSEQTISILKNFSLINPSIAINPGNVLKTISPLRTIFAKATVSETFTNKFAIYELNKFLGAITLLDNPEFEFYDNHLKMTKGKQTLRYAYADIETILTPPEKEIKLPSEDIKFDLAAADLIKVQKSLSVLQLPEISIIGDDGNIFVKAVDNKKSTTDHFSIAVGVTDKNFNAIIAADNLKMMMQDYSVVISEKGISQFTSKNVTYWIALESRSTF